VNRWLVLALAACDAGRGPAPAPIPPPPPPPPPKPAPAPPPRDTEVAPTIARWSTKPIEGHASSPTCVHANDRMIQYAELDGDRAARFCLWWNLKNEGFPDVGCWSVDLATGTYRSEGGVWFSSPQPGRGDHGETSATIDDHDSATLTGTSLIVKHDDHVTGRLDVHGKGAIVLARSTDLVVPDRDGRVLLVDHDAKITRTFTPPACAK
jgi:hypothetical protein